MIRKREGFTLVELLVVIAIIIILAAILFPIFAKAREKAQQTRCLNNLKQMATAAEMYEDDYEGGILPDTIGAGQAGQEVGATAADKLRGNMWGDLMDKYLKQLQKGKAFGETAEKIGEIFICPSVPMEEAKSGAAWFSGKSYGYNPYLKKNISAAMVKYPSLTLRATESLISTFDPHNLPKGEKDMDMKGGSLWAPVPSPKTTGYTYPVWAPGWHNGHNDVLWFDGHVSSITWERVMYTDNYNNTNDPNVWCRLSPKAGYTAE